MEELTGLEDDADLAVLVEKVSSSLTDRQRDIFALYGAGCKRPQIADRLGLPERDVKEQLRLIMDKARAPSLRASPGADASEESRWSCGSSAASPPPTRRRAHARTSPVARLRALQRAVGRLAGEGGRDAPRPCCRRREPRRRGADRRLRWREALGAQAARPRRRRSGSSSTRLRRPTIAPSIRRRSPPLVPGPPPPWSRAASRSAAGRRHTASSRASIRSAPPRALIASGPGDQARGDAAA